MIKDEIEAKLKQVKWVKTVSAPSEVVDYQERNKYPYKRLILMPDDFKYVTPEVLDELINSKVQFGSAEILEKAKVEYEKKQKTLTGTTVAENGMIRETVEMRNRLKKVIDDFPVEKLSTLAELIIDLYEAEKTKARQPRTKAVEEWEEKIEIAGEGDVRVAIIELANNEAADLAEKAFLALSENTKLYKSAVILNGTTVRTVEFEIATKGTAVVIFHATGTESALGMRMLFDGTLNKEVIILRVTRTELKLSVTYRLTGIKAKPKGKPKKFTFEDTNGYELVEEETGKPVFRKREKGGEGGETPFLVKRGRE